MQGPENVRGDARQLLKERTRRFHQQPSPPPLSETTRRRGAPMTFWPGRDSLQVASLGAIVEEGRGIDPGAAELDEDHRNVCRSDHVHPCDTNSAGKRKSSDWKRTRGSGRASYADCVCGTECIALVVRALGWGACGTEHRGAQTWVCVRERGKVHHGGLCLVWCVGQ